MSEQNQAEQNPRNFALQRIYVKDLSFETPNSPAVFTEAWKPESNLNLNSSVTKLTDHTYEVVLTVTVTTKVGDKTAYLVEVQQAGVFIVQGFPEAELGPMLGVYCPNVLFPYARETVSDLVTRGSFPQLLLTPVNFDALYVQHLQEQRKKSAENANKAH
ncbi:MAG: protein-export chaperone SecB [Gammaproteobacteria bacterium]|nr:protein-export chaperone SecB [Gammaproteobacteria bacterium]MCB1851705.1 protein-export chaperone SecB [Gammaproteobacteria bacterium]MCP5417175.1 protein-export chaperone SecB [Chromatiaceae bacterium]